ncbi:MAG: hypothetical protein K2K70_01510 [Lachnospiraceae bacterium]|nr:hypothetical protein [Lachnospiraceae bacterium]
MNIHRRYLKVALVSVIIIGILLEALIWGMLFYRQDVMQKYNVYHSGYYVIVRNKENSETFYFEEWILYSYFFKDAYLCTKEGKKARSEKEAYLYVDLGERGGWWADPFGNLQKDKAVENEYIPDGLIDELKKHVHLGWGNAIIQMINEAEVNELTEDEVKRIAPEVFAEVYDAEAVGQSYYEVDFDNDRLPDIVINNKLGMGMWGFSEEYFYRQMPDGRYSMTHRINSSGSATRFLQYDGKTYFMDICILDYNAAEKEYDYQYCEVYYFRDGHPLETVRLTPENNQLVVTVRKRFVNDFINISEGWR